MTSPPLPATESVDDVLDRMSDAFVALDDEWRVTYLNQRAEEMFDRPAEELQGAIIWRALPHLSDTAIEDGIRRAMARGEPVTFETYYGPRDAWFEFRVHPGAGGLSIFARDVTASKRTEHRAISYEEILDAMSDAVWLIDGSGTLIYVNQAVVTRLGVSKSTLVGESYRSRLSALFPDTEEAETYERFVEEIREGERESGRFEFELTLAGEPTVIEFDFAHIGVGDDRGVLVVARDITERAERERQMGELRREYETVFQNTQDALFLVDVVGESDGERTFRYSRVNRVEEELIGLSTDEIRGKTPTDVFGSEMGERLESNYRDCIQKREPLTYEEELSFTDETRIWQTKLTPVVVDGEVDGIVGAARDITKLREYERRLEGQRDQLQLLNRLVRHDIRNDMTVVLGFAEMLYEEVPDVHRDDVERILETSRHTVELTKTARDLVGMIRRDEKLRRVPVSLADALVEEFENAKRSYPDAVFEIDGELPEATVQANDLLPAVFRNLLHNAVQHNDKPTPRVAVSVRERDDTVAVRIADNGVGIPDERKDEIFSREVKGLDSPGTGMGLYLVRTLLEHYGGDVRVMDNEPEGTIFEVVLQRAGCG